MCEILIDAGFRLLDSLLVQSYNYIITFNSIYYLLLLCEESPILYNTYVCNKLEIHISILQTYYLFF